LIQSLALENNFLPQCLFNTPSSLC